MYEELIMRLLEDKSWIEQGTTETEHEIADHLQKAADAIEGLSGLVDHYGGETGIKNSQEYASKYWDLLKNAPRWISVTETLPDKFQSVFAACKSEGRENWTIDTVYDPFLKCPWGRIPILESGKAVVYAWMDNSVPEPPKEEEM